MSPATVKPLTAQEARSRRALARASAINTFALLIAGAAALAQAILTTQVLNVHDRGAYAILITLAGILGTVLGACAPVMVADLVHGRRDVRQVRGAAAFLSLAVAAVLVVAIVLVDASPLHLPSSVAALLMSAGATAVLIYAACEIAFSRSQHDLRAVNLGEIGLASLPLALAVLVTLAGHSDVESLILAWLVGVSCVAAVQIARAVRKGQFTLAHAPSMARELAWRSRSIAFSNGILTLCARIDVLIVSVVLSVSAAGIYSIPVALAANLILFAQAIVTATYKSMLTAPLPELRERLMTTVRYGAVAVLGGGAIGVPLVAVAAGPVFGDPYAHVWRQLAILVPGIAALSVVDAVRHVLVSRLERSREVLLVAIGMVVVNGVLAVAGSAWFGLNGAAASTSITYIVAALAMISLFSVALRAASSSEVATGAAPAA
jgi:O-antigen/teichoic acid export membrane protein